MAVCTVCGRAVPEGCPECPDCKGTVGAEPAPLPVGVLARPGAILGGRYRVERTLGSGSSGVVYGVTDLRERNLAALKVLHPELLGFGALNRLQREVRLVRDLNCPNLVKVYHLEDLGGLIGLKMEWVQGESLRARLKREGPLPATEVLRLARDLFQALDALHGLSIVHRDVKSANLLLSQEGSLKLGDFGLARDLSVQGSLTRQGAVLGTVGYMAPEVAQGKEATPLSDLYSAGCVLFEMLTGELPYEGESLDSLWRQAVEAPRLGLLARRAVPRWLGRLVARLLEKNPADRYRSAKEVLDALEARWAGLYLPGRYKRRGMLSAAVLGGALALLGAGLWLDGRLLPRATFAGSTLTVRGPFGNLRFEKTFDRVIRSVRVGRFGPGGRPAVAVALSWREGMPEGDLVSPMYDETASRLLLFDGRGDLEVQKPLTLSALFPGFPNRLDVFLDAHRFGPGEPERLVVMARHHLWYPTFVGVHAPLSTAGRDVIFEGLPLQFPHSGYLDFPPLYRDLNGDGRDEMVLLGVNNLLYRMQVVAALEIPEVEETTFLAEPAARFPMAESSPPPLLYRGVDLYRTSGLRWGRSEGRGPLAILSVKGPFTLGTGLDVRGASGEELAPQSKELPALHARLRRLFLLRESGDFEALLEEAKAWPEGLPEPYGWMGVFFEAHALEGLGRSREVRPLLEAFRSRTAPEDPLTPYYYFRFWVESAFLGGDYAGGLAAFAGLPEVVRRMNREVSEAAFWCAVYQGDETFAGEMAADAQGSLSRAGQILLAHDLALRGDAAAAEAAFSRLPLETVQFPEALLFAAAFEAERGRFEEAEKNLDRLHARFSGEEPDGGETEAWVRFLSRPESPPWARMEAAVDRRRKAARIGVEDRALLPLTLARAAAVFRAAGQGKRADSLSREALSLAPPSWRARLREIAGTPREGAGGKRPGSAFHRLPAP